MTTKRIALVTGANKGIGFETARELTARGWTVWLGARDEDRGRRAASELGHDARFVPLDVTSDESVSAARKLVEAESGRLDALVNNAGISGVGDEGFEAAIAQASRTDETRPADFLPVFGVNLLGPVRVTAEFLPLLRQSAAPRLVMVSSGVGSFGVHAQPDSVESKITALVYPSSKAALNMVTLQYAKSLPDVRVCAVDPGYTATDLNGNTGTQSVVEGAEAVVTACVADELPGTFFNRHGVVPW